VLLAQAAQDCNTVGRIVCEKAEQLQAEQVFVGGSSGHRSKLAVLVSGSVVQYVKRHCKVPVTVVVQQGSSMTPEQLAS
jgi:nucleotide-binding universal stress UspA family protein